MKIAFVILLITLLVFKKNGKFLRKSFNLGIITIDFTKKILIFSFSLNNTNLNDFIYNKLIGKKLFLVRPNSSKNKTKHNKKI